MTFMCEFPTGKVLEKVIHLESEYFNKFSFVLSEYPVLSIKLERHKNQKQNPLQKQQQKQLVVSCLLLLNFVSVSSFWFLWHSSLTHLSHMAWAPSLRNQTRCVKVTTGLIFYFKTADADLVFKEFINKVKNWNISDATNSIIILKLKQS